MDTQRAARYDRLTEQLRGLIEDNSPTLQSAMSTICAVLHAKMKHQSWTGFYIVSGTDRLHVGPYQGPVACQVLEGQGACLQAASTGKPVVIGDVSAFPGHITCDSRSKSEIVIPLIKEDRVIAILDIDSAELNQFTDADIAPLTRILSLLHPYL